MRDIKLQLYSGSALLLVAGRKEGGGKSKIVSLKEFNTKIVMIENAARSGCPFAQISIKKMDEKLQKNMNDMRLKISTIKQTQSRIVVGKENRKMHTIDISGYFHRAVRMADLIAAFDDLTDACHSARLRGSMAKTECYQQINHHKKRIRGIMNYAMLYTDHNFRHSNDQTSIEWKKMVSLFGAPISNVEEGHALRKESSKA